MIRFPQVCELHYHEVHAWSDECTCRLTKNEKKEIKLSKKGYKGLTVSSVSKFELASIKSFIKECKNDIFMYKEDYPDDNDVTNYCYQIWFEKEKDFNLFKQLLDSFPKRKHHLLLNIDYKDIKKYTKQGNTLILQGNDKLILSTNDADMATLLKLQWA